MRREVSIPIHTENRGGRPLGRISSLLVAALAVSFASGTFGQTEPENRLGRALSQVSGSSALTPEQRLPRGEHPRTGAVIGVLRSEQGTPLAGSRVVLWATPGAEKAKPRRTALTSFATT